MDRKALFKISYGLYVITSKKGDKFNGQIANTVVQTTAEPPMIAICLNKLNLTHEFVEASKVAAVSVLAQDTPLEFIGRFGFKSGRDTDKFEGMNYRIGETGAPIVLDHAIAYFEMKVVASMGPGTHTLFAGEVVAAEILDATAEPMTYAYYHEVKRGKSPKTAPTYIAEVPAAARYSPVGSLPSGANGIPPRPGPKQEEPEKLALPKWVCMVCGYVYDPEAGDADGGIAPGTAFEDIPNDWVCPVCGAGKDQFELVKG